MTISDCIADLSAAYTLWRLRDLYCLYAGSEVNSQIRRSELLYRFLLGFHDGRQGRVAGLYETINIIRESSGN